MKPGTECAVQAAAHEIAGQITAAARTSGADPIVWVTSNTMMPPLRWFAAAERIWQNDANADGEAFAYLAEVTGRLLDAANVFCDAPDYDNALYAVDLRRFEYVESADGENLADDWVPRTTPTDDSPDAGRCPVTRSQRPAGFAPARQGPPQPNVQGPFLEIGPGTVFATPFETGCVAKTAPDPVNGNFDGTDSDGVPCLFWTGMVRGHANYRDPIT